MALGASPCPGWAVQLCEYYLISTSQQQICEKYNTGLIFFFRIRDEGPGRGKLLLMLLDVNPVSCDSKLFS